jgi:hypothetical protein
VLGCVIGAALFVGSCSHRFDQSKFSRLNAASRTVHEATTAGVTLAVFQQLLSAYSKEVSLAISDGRSSDERQFVGFHTRALAAYEDSVLVWNEKVQQRQSALETGSNVELRRIIDEYSVDSVATRLGREFNADSAMQTIWKRAETQLDAAAELYRPSEKNVMPIAIRPPHDLRSPESLCQGPTCTYSRGLDVTGPNGAAV